MKHGINAIAFLGLTGLAAALAAVPSPRALHVTSGIGGSAMAATLESREDRASYMKAAAARMEEWRQRVENLTLRARRAGTPEALAILERIMQEWSLVESTWHVLTVSEGVPWEEAQVSYEQATDSFTRTWNEQVADDF